MDIAEHTISASRERVGIDFPFNIHGSTILFPACRQDNNDVIYFLCSLSSLFVGRYRRERGSNDS